MRTGEIGVKLTACIITIVAVVSARQAAAGKMPDIFSAYKAVYPTNTCVSAKMTAAAAYCKSTLNAWSTWDNNQDSTKRDASLSKAATTVKNDWNKAEAASTKKGVDCAQTTLSLSDLQSLVDGVVADVKDEINHGLALSNPRNKNDANCGSKLLNAAATKCPALLNAEAKFIKGLAKDPTGAARDLAITKASATFAKSWSKAAPTGTCNTTATATEDAIEGKIDDLNDQVVMDTTVSPNVPSDTFKTIPADNPTKYLGKTLNPICKDGTSPYAFFVKRGSVNKLLMYYQGGGACWSEVSCGGTFLTKYQPLCDPTVDPSGSDNPNNSSNHYGFGDLSNPQNPFHDWNIVFVSYCSCDIHYGSAEQEYSDYGDGNSIYVVHHGFQNARVAEKWAREHFVSPDMVFVTGSSAGAYGAVFNAPLLEKVWPASQFRVLGDAGNGVITKVFLLNEFTNWNFSANLPTGIPGVVESFSGSTPTGMVGYIEAVAAYFPDTSWAHYATAFDGGMGGQTGFYHVMAEWHYALWPSWWSSSCDWNDLMVRQANDTYTAVAATNNYRYYIGSGSRHTMWGSDKVYGDPTAPVAIVDWINAMLNGKTDPGWVNVTASPFNVLLPDDPEPDGTCSNPPHISCHFDTDCGPGNTCSAPNPFQVSGSDVIVNCP